MGNIGNLSSVGQVKNNGGGSVVGGLVFKKIYKSENDSYIVCLLPSSIQTVADLINYMINDYPYKISRYTSTDGTSYSWSKTAAIGCSGVHSYSRGNSSLLTPFEIYTIQTYHASASLPIDYTQFPIPTSVTYRCIQASSGNPVSTHSIDDTWLIVDL